MRRYQSSLAAVAIAAVLVPSGARATTTSCNITQPCAVFANNSGIALEGQSAGADGVLGEASSGTIYGAGIEGESLMQTGADAAGTFGLTLLSNGVAPNYGVVAYGSLYGVYGQAGNTGLSSTGPGYGVFGQDNAGTQFHDYNAGVTGLSANNVGVLAEGSGSPTESFYGIDGIPIGLYAVAKATNGNSSGQSIGAVVEADSFAGFATRIVNTAEPGSLSIGDPNFLVDDIDNANALEYDFSIAYSGTQNISGKLTAKGGTASVRGGPYLRTTGASGRTVTAYTDHTTTPELDDSGEAQLVNGRAFVPIDAALADVIDRRGGYEVFVTPEGDTEGLYIVKGAGGFVVREEGDGRSTLPFYYRIAAKPREEHGARLARVTDVAPRIDPVPGDALEKTQHIPLPLSPEERLKRKIGPRAYAAIVAELSRRFAALPAR